MIIIRGIEIDEAGRRKKETTRVSFRIDCPELEKWLKKDGDGIRRETLAMEVLEGSTSKVERRRGCTTVLEHKRRTEPIAENSRQDFGAGAVFECLPWEVL